jgi:VWFA-related protein
MLRSGVYAAVLAAAPAMLAQPQIRTQAEEVVLDVVVRDAKGKIVRGLKAEDFQVFDNGSPKQVRSVRLVTGAEAVGVETSTAASGLSAGQPAQGAAAEASDPRLRLVTLVFDSLTEESRGMARRAALELVKAPPPNTYFSVLRVDKGLQALTPYTSDPARLRQAVDKALTGNPQQTAATEAQGIRRDLEQLVGSPQLGRSVEEEAVVALEKLGQGMRTGQSATAGGPMGDFQTRTLIEVMLRMLEYSESMDRQVSGRTSIASLMALVRSMMPVPGRKSVIYFANRLHVPQQLEEDFRNLISTANRTNTTFYTADARGLHTESDNKQAASELRKWAKISTMVAYGGDTMNYILKREQEMALDKAADASAANPQLGLLELANATGGFLTANTNDLRGPVRRIQEDLSTYYEVTYAPGIAVHDGTFHKTEVKVDRPKLQVQARSGYFALPPNLPSGVLPHEATLLAALNSPGPPSELDARLRPILFGRGESERQAVLILEVPMRGLEFKIEGDRFQARVSAVFLVRSAEGRVVRKYNIDMPLEGPADRVPRLREGRFIYKERTTLAPGVYRVHAGVIDRLTQRIGTAQASLTVELANGLAVSDIVLVRSFADASADADPDDPFALPGVQITPTASAELEGGRNAEVGLFFAVYPDTSNASPPAVALEYFRDGEVVDSEALDPQPAKDGRIVYMLTSKGRRPGAYEVRVTATQAARTATGRLRFTLSE